MGVQVTKETYSRGKPRRHIPVNNRRELTEEVVYSASGYRKQSFVDRGLQANEKFPDD